MSHPSHNYIKFMLVQNRDNETRETVNRTLRSFGFPDVSKDEYIDIEANLQTPDNFTFNNRLHKPTAVFMNAEGLHTLWVRDKYAVEAVNILNYPQIRETIQLLLLGRFPSKDIVERVKAKYGREFSVESIEAFRHYFWRCDQVGVEELGIMYRSHPMKDAYIAAMVGSRNQALFRAGFSPQIDGHKALREAHRNVAMRIEASRILPDDANTARLLSALTKELLTLHQALYGEGAGVESLMKDLQKFVMERKAPIVIPITKLAPNGNFSRSGKKNEEGLN